jgi:hypothetical protein
VPPAQTAVLDALLEQTARAVPGGHSD